MVTVFLAVIVKLVMYFVLVQLLQSPLQDYLPCTRPMFVITAGLSIIVGCFGAIFQKRIKRLLAYSSINNAGFGVAGLAVCNIEGMKAGLAYIVFYCLALLLIFSIILNCKIGTNKQAITYIGDLKYLKANRDKFQAIVMPIVFSLTLFSLAGIPPLTGF